MNTEIQSGNEIVDVDFTQRKVVIHERYERLHIISELLLGVWFLAGSIMFFYAHWTYWGTWLFVIGSAQMMVGPVIRITKKVHLRKVDRQQAE